MNIDLEMLKTWRRADAQERQEIRDDLASERINVKHDKKMAASLRVPETIRGFLCTEHALANFLMEYKSSEHAKQAEFELFANEMMEKTQFDTVWDISKALMIFVAAWSRRFNGYQRDLPLPERLLRYLFRVQEYLGSWAVRPFMHDVIRTCEHLAAMVGLRQFHIESRWDARAFDRAYGTTTAPRYVFLQPASLANAAISWPFSDGGWSTYGDGGKVLDYTFYNALLNGPTGPRLTQMMINVLLRGVFVDQVDETETFNGAALLPLTFQLLSFLRAFFTSQHSGNWVVRLWASGLDEALESKLRWVKSLNDGLKKIGLVINKLQLSSDRLTLIGSDTEVDGFKTRTADLFDIDNIICQIGENHCAYVIHLYGVLLTKFRRKRRPTGVEADSLRDILTIYIDAAAMRYEQIKDSAELTRLLAGLETIAENEPTRTTHIKDSAGLTRLLVGHDEIAENRLMRTTLERWKDMVMEKIPNASIVGKYQLIAIALILSGLMIRSLAGSVDNSVGMIVKRGFYDDQSDEPSADSFVYNDGPIYNQYGSIIGRYKGGVITYWDKVAHGARDRIIGRYKDGKPEFHPQYQKKFGALSNRYSRNDVAGDGNIYNKRSRHIGAVRGGNVVYFDGHTHGPDDYLSFWDGDEYTHQTMSEYLDQLERSYYTQQWRYSSTATAGAGEAVTTATNEVSAEEPPVNGRTCMVVCTDDDDKKFDDKKSLTDK